MSPFRFAAVCGFFILVPTLALAEEMAPVALNSLSAVPSGAIQVLDQNGHLLGQVERIQTDQDGKPSAMAFRAGDKTLVISAAAASYDGKVLIASNDQPQIAALTQAQRTAAN
jgi:hypothetical protein